MTDPNPTVLGVDDISVSYSGRQILTRVTFELRAGEFTGLIGSNGAGKTTLLRVILGLQKPNAGQVLMNGEPLSRRNRSIGYVPQKVVLDPDMPLRARDLVTLGLDGHRFGIPLRSARRNEAVDEMLHAVDAFDFADSRVGKLSGGEQQRVLIAHALISRPELLLLDEPLANLDLRSAQEIIGLLDRISNEQRIAVFLSAHEMNPLLPVMDRVVYIVDGRAASGTTEEVIRPEVLSALYGHQVDVLNVRGRILVVAGPMIPNPTKPETGLMPASTAPDPPAADTSVRAWPPKDWPRMTVNTPTTPETTATTPPITSAVWTGWLSKKPGSKIDV
jgi:zinc/manganese transport system ATP-binding protein